MELKSINGRATGESWLASSWNRLSLPRFYPGSHSGDFMLITSEVQLKEEVIFFAAGGWRCLPAPGGCGWLSISLLRFLSSVVHEFLASLLERFCGVTCSKQRP